MAYKSEKKLHQAELMKELVFSAEMLTDYGQILGDYCEIRFFKQTMDFYIKQKLGAPQLKDVDIKDMVLKQMRAEFDIIMEHIESRKDTIGFDMDYIKENGYPKFEDNDPNKPIVN